MQNEIHVRADAQPHEVKQVPPTTCCVVGGGPAGAMLALLLARQGIPVTLLEAHADFNRDFRGDTVHPSVLAILSELGLADRLLQIPHTLMTNLSFQTRDGVAVIADFKRLKTKHPYIAMIPQVDFLEFITTEASRYPSFRLVMGAQVDELLYEGDRVCGVRYRARDGWYALRAALTVGADGRFSRIRKLAAFTSVKTSPPMDILWFRLTRKPDDPNQPFGRFGKQLIVAVLNRGEYWQVGYVIPKGSYQTLRAAGLERVRQTLAEAVPALAERVNELQDWHQVSLLSVESSRVRRWYRPGLLLIGDAAHVMSPVGGVGINYAIQDAVVAANVLTPRLKYGITLLQDLAEVQRRREWPTRFIQSFQGFMQKLVFVNALDADKPFVLPVPFKLLLYIPILRDLPAHIIAFGIWPVHVKYI